MLEKRIFTGGMDQDTTTHLIEQGDYRYALNCRIGSSDTSNILAVENTKGNTLISYTLPAGSNKVIGSCDDKTNQKVYYFVHNTGNNHLILEYSYATGTIALVLQTSLLNFSLTSLITGVNSFEGSLSWVEPTNECREIDINKAKLHSAGNFTSGYPSPLTEEYITANRVPPECHPTAVYSDDTTRKVNYLENKLFQFKYRYWYFNYSSSTYSPISAPPLPAVVCGNSSPNPSKNNRIRVTVETGSPICTRVEIAMRIGNTGDFYTIADLDKTQLNISSNSTYTYDFYNDRLYNSIEVNESNLLFDNLWPSKAQEITQNRKFVANTTEGYDPVNVNMKLNLGYAPATNTQLYSITGNLYIKNPQLQVSGSDYANYQPIHNPSGTTNPSDYVWGGVANLLGGMTNNIGSDYKQRAPLGGFPVYLAGTRFYGVSKQVAAVSGGVQTPEGVYLSDGAGINPASNISNMRDNIQAQNCYSTFTISGVPIGSYIMRVGSPETTSAELLDPAFSYQRKSTNAVSVGGSGVTECEIVIQQNGDVFVNGVQVTVTNNSFSVGETHIFDLTDADTTLNATGLIGYLTDCDVQPTPGTYAGLLNDTRIEMAAIGVNGGTSTTYNALKNNYSQTQGWPTIALTDHNGYYFYSGQNFSTGSLTAQNIYAGTAPGTAPNNFDTNAAAFSGVSGSQVASIVSRTPGAASPFNNYRTAVSSTMIDSNAAFVEGGNIVIARSGYARTDINGAWSITIYAPFSSTVRNNRVYYSLTDNCIGTFTNPFDTFNIVISGAATGQTVFTSPYPGLYSFVGWPTETYGLTVVQASVTVLAGGSAVLSWKRGADYQLGAVYYDWLGRSSLVNTHDEPYTQLLATNSYGLRLYIPFYTEGTPVIGQGRPSISWEIWNVPPIWATHYQIVARKNSFASKYLQFTAENVIPSTVDRVQTSWAAAQKVGLVIQNIADFVTRYNDAEGQVEYDFAKGDRVRFKAFQNGNLFPSYVDLKIRDYDPAGIIYVDYVSQLANLTSGCLMELYTPKLPNEADIYYEIGECYEIGDAGLSTRYHKGPTQDQSFLTQNGLPATGTLGGFDTYYRARTMEFLNSSSLNSYQLWEIEDIHFSDFFSSAVANIGRPNRVDNNYRQVRRPTTVYYSGQYVPETQINGLNRFFDTTFDTYDHAFRSIQKLHGDNHVLEVYFETKVGEIPLSLSIIYDNAGQSVVGTSDNILNPIRYNAGDFGISLNPESFASYGNARYFFDLNHGAVLRKSVDGLTPISDYKMRNFFLQKSKLYQQNNTRPNVYGAYDANMSEYLMCFETSQNASRATIDGFTASFNEKQNRWESFWSYLPDNICSAGVEIVSFKNGAIYLHNSNNTYNNFYGTQYNSEIWAASNVDPSKVKVYTALSEESNAIWTMFGIENEAGQDSNLIDQDFSLREGVYYAALLRDSNTPNVTNPVLNGDVLRGPVMVAKLRNSSTTLVKLFAVNFQVIPSERSNR